MSRQKIYIALIFGIFCISSSSIFVKYLDYRGVPLIGVAAYRMLLSSLILLGINSVWRSGEILKLGRTKLTEMVISGIFLAAHFGSWTLSLKYIPVGRSVLLVTCHPIFTILVSRIFLGEKISLRNILSVLVAFAGIIVILWESLSSFSVSSSFLLGDLLALTGAATIVGYIIIGKRLRSSVNLLNYTLIVYATSALLLLPAALLVGVFPQTLTAGDYFWLLALAIVPTLGGHMVFNFLLKNVNATFISTAFLGESLGAALLAWIIWKEVPSASAFIGGIFVIAGLYMIKFDTDSVKQN